MINLFIFLFGSFVTLVVAAVTSGLLHAAYRDGAKQKRAEDVERVVSMHGQRRARRKFTVSQAS